MPRKKKPVGGAPGAARRATAQPSAASDAACHATAEPSDAARHATAETSDAARHATAELSDAASRATAQLSDAARHATAETSDAARHATARISDAARHATAETSDAARHATAEPSDAASRATAQISDAARRAKAQLSDASHATAELSDAARHATAELSDAARHATAEPSTASDGAHHATAEPSTSDLASASVGTNENPIINTEEHFKLTGDSKVDDQVKAMLQEVQAEIENEILDEIDKETCDAFLELDSDSKARLKREIIREHKDKWRKDVRETLSDPVGFNCLISEDFMAEIMAHEVSKMERRFQEKMYKASWPEIKDACVSIWSDAMMSTCEERLTTGINEKVKEDILYHLKHEMLSGVFDLVQANRPSHLK